MTESRLAPARDDDTAGGCARSVIVTVLDAVAELGARNVSIASIVLTFVVCLGDYVTGFDVSFSVFYLVPVFLAAGTASRRAGLVVAAVAAFAWLAADVFSRAEPYTTPAVPVWNVVVRFLMFWLVAALVSSLRAIVVHERSLSRTDSLSGLANSRGFFDLAANELARARRHGRPTTVAYLDIDDFKVVNDTLGHTEGDQVIMRTGDTIRAALRATDIAGRLGGDEFALVLPETDRRGAEVALATLHQSLSDLAREQRWPIGYSIGVVTFANAPRSLDDVVSQADALMYEVKQSGKRSVRFASFDDDARGRRGGASRPFLAAVPRPLAR